MQKLLKDCKILDVVNQRVSENRSILVEGSRIKKIGPVEELAPFEKFLKAPSVFQLGGRLVLPGLIEAHVHLNFIPASNELETTVIIFVLPKTQKVLWGAKNAKETLEAGFTTVKDVGSAGDNLALRERIEKGLIPGPRIVACGWVTQTGGQGELWSSERVYNVELREPDVGVGGPWEIRKKVRQVFRELTRPG